MIEYPKISGPFKREVEGPNRNKLILGEWARPEFAYLQACPWIFTEKIDGTNIRIHWDGHRVEVAGRTDRADLRKDLLDWIDVHLPEELFEQTFGADGVILFGEGFGAGIQKGGGNYSAHKQFALFDVLVGGWWLTRDSVDDVAAKLGIATAPIVMVDTLSAAIDCVAGGLGSSWGDFEAEGLVGQPPVGLCDRSGKRLLIKIKAGDFR